MTAVRRGLPLVLLCLLATPVAAARADRPPRNADLVEVVVTLAQKPLGTTTWRAGRQLQSRTLANAQAGVASRIETSVPDAQIRWRYRLVANGMAVVVPRSQLPLLTSLPGVETVYPSVRYRTQLDRSPQQIGAPALWTPGLASAGQGMKIAIIDEGIDQTHPFFSPAGYTMPAGFPKGQTAYTTAKVIVARAFPPARPLWKHASKPFDPQFSSHGTHVAGMAAGNDFQDFGCGSVGSPGSSPDAITVGAVTTTRGGADDVVAPFSSSGPTPLSLRLKPEVSAPGVAILSASPGAAYSTLSGTSMAAPHVAGAVALLLQRHPSWTAAQLKSALALTGDEAFSNDLKSEELSTVRGGGGVVNLPRADNPLVFADPVALSFGLIGTNASVIRSVELTDAGGGGGTWNVTVER